jgi:TRAP-type C4-dicarboxylate transport system substrate-binding protein
MQIIIKLIISLLVSLTFSKSVIAADFNFKFGTVSADTEPLLDAMRYMAKNIEDRSNG